MTQPDKSGLDPTAPYGPGDDPAAAYGPPGGYSTPPAYTPPSAYTPPPADDPSPYAPPPSSTPPGSNPPSSGPPSSTPPLSAYTPGQPPDPYGTAPASDPFAQPTPYGQPPAAGYGADAYGQPVAAYGQPGYGYPGYGYPASEPTNGLAIASLVVSILGAVGLCFYGLGGYIGIVGAILGHVAGRQIRERGGSGAGLAKAGVITGWIAAGIAVVATVLIIIFVVWAANQPPSTFE